MRAITRQKSCRESNGENARSNEIEFVAKFYVGKREMPFTGSSTGCSRPPTQMNSRRSVRGDGRFFIFFFPFSLFLLGDSGGVLVALFKSEPRTIDNRDMSSGLSSDLGNGSVARGRGKLPARYLARGKSFGILATITKRGFF